MELNDIIDYIYNSYEEVSGKRIDKSDELVDVFQTKLTDYIKDVIDDEFFSVNPYFGQKNWVNTPIIKVSHKDFLGSNFYLGLIFKKSVPGFYLVLFNKLNWDIKKRVYDYDTNYDAINRSRDLLKNNFSKDLFNDLLDEIDLNNRGNPKKYTEACIFAKEYSKDFKNFKQDMDDFIDMYLFLARNYESNLITTEEWIKVLNSEIISQDTFNLINVIKSLGGIAKNTDISFEKFNDQFIDYINEDFLINDIFEDNYDVSNFLSKDIITGEWGRNNFYNCFFYGKKLNDDLEFILHKELSDALEKYLDESSSSTEFYEEEKENIPEKENVGEEIISFYDYLIEKGYFYDKWDIENFLLSLKVKPFLIFTGNSGTGKTKLAQLFSQYISKYHCTDLIDVEFDTNVNANIEEGGSDSSITFDETYENLNNLNSLNDGNKEDFFKNLQVIFDDLENLKIINPTENLYDDDYFVIKLDTKSFLNTFKDKKINFRKEDFIPTLPLENYQGRCGTYVNNIPVKCYFTISPNIQYTSMDLYTHVKDLYENNPQEDIFIKIKRENLQDVIHMLPKWQGKYSTKIKLEKIRKKFFFFTPYEVDKLLDLEGYLNFFDIEIGDKIFNVKFYLSFGVRFLKSNQLDEFIEETSTESSESEIDVILDFDTFKYRVASMILTKSLPVSKFEKNKTPISTKDLNRFIPFNDISGIYPVIVNDICSMVRLNFNPYLYHNSSQLDNYLNSLDDNHLLDLRFVLPKNYFGGSFENQRDLPKREDIKILDLELDSNDFIENSFSLKNEDIIDIIDKNYFDNFKMVVDNLNVDCDVDFNLELTYLDENLKDYISNFDKVNMKIFLDFDEFEDYISEFIDFDDDLESNSNKLSYNENLIYQIVPVGANWTENRNIIGYYNIITNEYHNTPVYDLLIISKKFYKDPHFVILDEMNLSHVERYFADFLSAIESGETIPLYGIDKELEIPSNLFIIGTVNVDETTYMFSPKVLDRANVLEFETYSAYDYMKSNIDLSSPSGDLEFLENPLAGNDIREYGINELRNIFKGVTIDDKPFWNILSSEIYSFQSILKESGFDFGFRVINEIVRFMAVAWEYEGKPSNFTNWRRYFDAQIKQKLLPKLHGSEKIIGETLDSLYAKCLDNSIDKVEMAKYPESYKKLKEMSEVLRKQRYVSFIN